MRLSRELVLYGVVGSTSVVVDLLVFAWLTRVADVHPGLATALSTGVAIGVSFALNAVFTFRVRDRLLRRLGRFYTVGAGGIALSVVIVTAGVTAGMDEDVAKVLSVPPVVLLQYLLNRRWSFGPVAGSAAG